MKKIWIILIVILVLGLIVLASMGLAISIGERNCKPYELAGFKTEVNYNDGCMVFLNGEFVRIYKVEEYFEMQDLKQRMDTLNEVQE